MLAFGEAGELVGPSEVVLGASVAGVVTQVVRIYKHASNPHRTSISRDGCPLIVCLCLLGVCLPAAGLRNDGSRWKRRGGQLHKHPPLPPHTHTHRTTSTTTQHPHHTLFHISPLI